MKACFYFLIVSAASLKPQFRNGVLQSTDTDGLFDPESMWDLGHFLINYPVTKPNSRVMEKVFVDSEQREREVVTGWSCTFDKGLCESWMTKEVLSDSIKEDISLATRILDGSKPGNWYIRKGNDLSPISTGPSIDHTYYSVVGSFITTANYDVLKDTSYVLFTESMDLIYSQYYCLSFWYHIYGRSGSEPSKFEVLINKNPKNKNAKGWSSLFQVNTDVSNDRFDWKYASLNIKPDLEKEKDWKTVLFALIARRGGGYIPDIAIDDVQLRSDKCPEIPPRQKSEQELKEIEKRMENWSPLGTTPAAPIKVPQKDFYRHEFFTTPAPRVHVQSAIDKTKEEGKTIIGPLGSSREFVGYVTKFSSNSCIQNVPLGEFKDMRNIDKAICCGGRPYHKVSGDSCCESRPFFQRKQICCAGEVLSKRKFECCEGKKIEKSSEICCGGKAQARYPGAKCCEQKKTVYNHNKYECCGSRIYKRGDLKRRNEFCCGAVAYSFETFPDGCCNQQLLQGGKSCCSVTRWKERVYNEQDEICCDGVFSAYLYQCKITKKGERKVLKLTNDQRKAMFDIDFPGEYRWVNKAAFAAMVKGTGKHVKLSEDEYEDYMQSILSPGAPIF